MGDPSLPWALQHGTDPLGAALVSTPVFSSLHVGTAGTGPRICAQHPACMEGAAAVVWEGVRG